MTRTSTILALTVLSIPLVVGSEATADHRRLAVRARLSGASEVPAVSSTGSGTFRAKVDRENQTIQFELSFRDLEGATVIQAHIHLGQKGVNGGVMAFLCGGPRPACPGPAGGEVTGTIVPADIIGPAGQGIAAGEFDEVVRALQEGLSYANVHTDKHPGGEIRGQIWR